MLKIFNTKRRNEKGFGSAGQTGNSKVSYVAQSQASNGNVIPKDERLKSPPVMISPVGNGSYSKGPETDLRRLSNYSDKSDTSVTSKESRELPSQSHEDHDVGLDEAEAERLKKLFSENNRKTRNLSISRSGRHKMRAHQRLSIVEGEMFNGEGGHCGSDVPMTLSISGPAAMV